MNPAQLLQTLARLDEAVKHIAKRPIDISDSEWPKDMPKTHLLDRAGVREVADKFLLTGTDFYQTSDESLRAEARSASNRHRSFS